MSPGRDRLFLQIRCRERRGPRTGRMDDDAPRLRSPRLRRLSQSEARRRRRRLIDTGAVKLFGVGSAGR